MDIVIGPYSENMTLYRTTDRLGFGRLIFDFDTRLAEGVRSHLWSKSFHVRDENNGNNQLDRNAVERFAFCGADAFSR